VPKQNRAYVRDGRLQVKKKRTDRSYLGAQPAAPATVEEAAPDQAVPDGTAPGETTNLEAATTASTAAAVAEPVETEVDPAPAAQPAEFTPQGRQQGAARALQQQGVRKRGELDVQTLAERDTKYAIHELRRILVLTALIIATLIVLAIVLR
jgi:hypothetical protein